MGVKSSEVGTGEKLRQILQELVDECTTCGSPSLGLIDKANSILAASEITQAHLGEITVESDVVELQARYDKVKKQLEQELGGK